MAITDFSIAQALTAGAVFSGTNAGASSGGRNLQQPPPGSNLTFRAYGTALSLEFYATDGAFNWSVDGGGIQTYSTATPGFSSQTLFSGLSDAGHDVTLGFTTGGCYLDDGSNDGFYFLELTGSAPSLAAFGSAPAGTSASAAADAGGVTAAATVTPGTPGGTVYPTFLEALAAFLATDQATAGVFGGRVSNGDADPRTRTPFAAFVFKESRRLGTFYGGRGVEWVTYEFHAVAGSADAAAAAAEVLKYRLIPRGDDRPDPLRFGGGAALNSYSLGPDWSQADEERGPGNADLYRYCFPVTWNLSRY